MKNGWHNLAVALGIILGLLFGSLFVDPPVSADDSADVDILMKVKQAGLWEMPVGAQLAERSLNPHVRDIGGRINAEHHELDAKTEDAAAATGISLPAKPSEEQQHWIAEVSAANVDNIDRVAVSRLRAAHGKVLPLLAQVKVGTRNPIIRAFTTDAMTYVSRHISYLESTGLVDYQALPTPTTTASPSPLSYMNYLGWGIAGAVLLSWLYRRVYPERAGPRHRKNR